MDKKIFSSLSCPFCAADLIEKKVLVIEGDEIIWGLISCRECRIAYPVVEGIPIIMAPEQRINVYAQTTKFGVDKAGITVAEICNNLERENIHEVCQSIIFSSAYKPNVLPKFVENMAADIVKRIIRKTFYSLFQKRGLEKQIKAILESDTSTAYDALKVYYQDHELFNYFFYKFGQPRFLTSLGLASIFGQPKKPILDLACGQGHLMHFLTYRYLNCSVIGVDRNFIQLFLAKKFIAPMGHYVCAEADEKLPFKKQSISNVICSDAFHYFQNKWSCIEDLRNIIDSNGAIIINRVGNQLVTPNEGTELTPSGYIRLFNEMPVKIVGDREVLSNYLKKKKPDLSGGHDSAQIKKQKWLSILASENDRFFAGHGDFDIWPHSIGLLNINPMYRKACSEVEGNEIFEFSYPSEWYKSEDSEWQTYAPDKISISSAVVDSLMQNDRSPDVNKLIDSYGILGFPEKYFDDIGM